MGRLGAPYGVKGWLWVQADTQHPDSLADYSEWWIGEPGRYQKMAVEKVELRPNGLVAKFAGIDDRDVVARLRGQLVAIPREAFEPAGDDEYYWTDLIGLAVVNLAGDCLGQVESLLETGANDVLVVKQDDVERLLPFVKAVVQSVDLEQRRIVVDWGLDY
jgi:16S rRNA processing protein RimM